MSAKKTTDRKTAAKAASAKNQAAKAAPKAKRTAQAQAAPAPAEEEPNVMDMDVRRPAVNPSMPPLKVGALVQSLTNLRNELEEYAAHLRALDRKRLNGVGIKKRGFVDTAYDLAVKNPEFLPHYVTVSKFRGDDIYFQEFAGMVEVANQIRELLWNLTIEASDMVYTDALEFYASAREAAKRRVDAAETIFNKLAPFFKRKGAEGKEPTDRQVKRDLNALLRGGRDGKIVVENIKPKLTAGKHKVTDEKFSDTAHFKEDIEGEIKE